MFPATTAGERLDSGPRFPFIALIVLRLQKVGLTVLTTATICSTFSRSAAADPAVEVFTQDGMFTSAGDGDASFLPQLPFRWTVTASYGYDSNVTTTFAGAGSAFTQGNVTVLKDLRTERTQLSLVLNAGVTHYLDQVDLPPTDYTGSLDLSLRHNVSERLALAASINAAYLSTPEFATDLGSARRRGYYFTTADSLTATYRLSPRLSADSTYLLGMVNYEDELVSLAQDRAEHTFGESLHYRWSPRTTLTTEYRFGLIDYTTFPRDSSTHTVLGGFDYQISPKLIATVRGGATSRKFKVENSQRTINPDWSGVLNYLINPSASVNWTISYSIEEPDFTETLSRTTFRTRTGLEFRYQVTRRLTANLRLNYNHDVNSGLLASVLPGADQQESTQDGFALVLGAKYAITNRLALDLGFTHSELNTENPIGGYSSNRYTAGLAFSY